MRKIVTLGSIIFLFPILDDETLDSPTQLRFTRDFCIGRLQVDFVYVVIAVNIFAYEKDVTAVQLDHRVDAIHVRLTNEELILGVTRIGIEPINRNVFLNSRFGFQDHMPMR